VVIFLQKKVSSTQPLAVEILFRDAVMLLELIRMLDSKMAEADSASLFVAPTQPTLPELDMLQAIVDRDNTVILFKM
jgi:hypothetical protein